MTKKGDVIISSLPSGHPVLSTLFEDIKFLRQRCQDLEIALVMQIRESNELASHLPIETVTDVKMKLWGTPPK